jgi:formate hydrogenlyase subunit 4
MKEMIYLSVQTMMFILMAPLVNGIINKVKAISQKRKGASVFQMYFDLVKLLKKTPVVSDVASWIFRVTPIIVFSTALVGSLLVPVSTLIKPNWYGGDMILLIYILALGRFFMMIGALDTGSTFGGMGASREAMISALIEPSIVVSLFTIGLIAKSTSIFDMMNYMKAVKDPLIHPVFILIFCAMFIIIIAETARIPVDDPGTHLELTMVHEAMVLEYSGRSLALMEYGAAIKQLIWITLLVNIFIPHDQFINLIGFSGVMVSILIYSLKIIIASVVIGIAEVSTVKLKLFSIPNLAALGFILSFIGFLQYFVFGG